MFSIDGLASGLDTTSIIEGLLSIQQQQVDRFDLRKFEVEEERAAFEEVESLLRSLQGTLANLSTPRTNAFQAKQVVSSDAEVVEATVSNDAINGVYAFRVNQLARNHQVASNDFSQPDDPIPDGTISISVGTGSLAQDIDIASAGGTIEGIAERINREVDDVTAAVIQTSTGFRLLLSADKTGAANEISVTVTAADPGDQPAMPTFDFDNPVQAAADSEIQIGTGAGAITVNNATNQVDELFGGVTIDLLKTSEGDEVQLRVESDVAQAKEALESFVEAYNAVITYTNEQTSFDPEDGTAGVLAGNRSLRSIRDDLSNLITQPVAGIGELANGGRFNRLTKLGIRLENNGTLAIRSDELDAALNGRVDGVGPETLSRLLGFGADSDNDSIQFLSATSDTRPSADGQPYSIRINQAPKQATLLGTDLAGSIVIDSSNNELVLSVDGFSVDESEPLLLDEGTYTQEELADHLELVIENSNELSSREVSVSVVDGKLQLRSQAYGAVSELSDFGGTSLSTLGLTTTSNARGANVLGSFAYLGDDGETMITEEATGTGRILRGNRGNERTAGLSVRVTVTPDQVTAGGGVVTSTLSVNAGIAAQLDNLIERMTDRSEGSEGIVKTAFDEFNGRIDSIDQSLARLNAQFDAQEQSLLRQFTALETRISELQNVGNLLAAQLASLPTIGGA